MYLDKLDLSLLRGEYDIKIKDHNSGISWLINKKSLSWIQK